MRLTGETRALLFGMVNALLASLFVQYQAYPSAVFGGLFSIYWFVLAAVREGRR